MAETWVCSGSLEPYGQSGVDLKTYERKGNSFIRLSESGESSFGIIKENKKFIILVETYEYAANLFVTILNKENNTFSEDFLGDFEKQIITMRGKCLVS